MNWGEGIHILMVFFFISWRKCQLYRPRGDSNNLDYFIYPGFYKIVRQLLERGAYPDPVNGCGTPLHIVAAECDDRSMKILLDHNADVSLSAYWFCLNFLFGLLKGHILWLIDAVSVLCFLVPVKDHKNIDISCDTCQLTWTVLWIFEIFDASVE
jgi:ankyrin repeat protein